MSDNIFGLESVLYLRKETGIMKKRFSTLFALLFLIAFQSNLGAQSLIVLGVSGLVNVSSWDPGAYTNKGLELSYERAILSSFSMHLGGTAHYGSHTNKFSETIVQHNRLLGVHGELRHHFQQTFSGSYVGLGLDVKHLNARNYFLPTPNYPEPTLVGTEVNLGLSFGTHEHLSNKVMVNPFGFIGFSPFSAAEYITHLRLGINIGIISE